MKTFERVLRFLLPWGVDASFITHTRLNWEATDILSSLIITFSFANLIDGKRNGQSVLLLPKGVDVCLLACPELDIKATGSPGPEAWQSQAEGWENLSRQAR